VIVMTESNAAAMIALFTDFGSAGPYVGQMKAAIYREFPGATIVDLLADAPVHNPRAAAYLLAALVREFPPGTVFLGVVDPGVGDPARRPAAVCADGQWFIGPDNGLFNVVAMRAASVRWWDIDWRPARLSTSFHGRDLFAPVAARVARGEEPPGTPCALGERLMPGWPDELAEIVYLDHFGNAMTGMRASALGSTRRLRIHGVDVAHARTFSAVPTGRAFWYENAAGLAELAVNRGNAGRLLNLAIGDRVRIV
jgi:S-adenosylmethionine hydrolase